MNVSRDVVIEFRWGIITRACVCVFVCVSVQRERESERDSHASHSNVKNIQPKSLSFR